MRRGLALLVVLALAARTSVAAEVVSYKGYTITGSPADDDGAFFQMVKTGIDMVDGLPQRLRSLGQLVRDLRYLPAGAAGADRGGLDDVTAVYIIETLDEARGHIAFRRDTGHLAPLHIALSLVGNGVHAKRHRDYVDARRKAAAEASDANRARAAYLEKLVKRTDLNLVAQAECENMAAIRDTLRALDGDARQIEGISRLMDRRNC